MTFLIVRGAAKSYFNNICFAGELYSISYASDLILGDSKTEFINGLQRINKGIDFIKSGETWTFLEYDHIQELENAFAYMQNSTSPSLPSSYQADVVAVYDYIVNDCKGKVKFHRFPAMEHGFLMFGDKSEAVAYKLKFK